MPYSDETKAEQLRRLFEGREAIYVEYGALRVKVAGIRAAIAQRSISAEVEEIPTPGLPVGALYESSMWGPRPMRWSIEGGYLAEFSDNRWRMGYGGGPSFSLRGLWQVF